jgi:hypothetical protein
MVILAILFYFSKKIRNIWVKSNISNQYLSKREWGVRKITQATPAYFFIVFMTALGKYY